MLADLRRYLVFWDRKSKQNFTPYPKYDKDEKSSIYLAAETNVGVNKIGKTSTFDGLMITMGAQRNGALSSTMLQAPSSIGLMLDIICNPTLIGQRGLFCFKSTDFGF